MNSAEIKSINKKKIYELIYERKNIAKSDIASILGLSFPTVSLIIKELASIGVVEEAGYFQSAGGRKAAIISSISDTKIAIGVEILKESIEIVAIDIYGNILKSHKQNLIFESSALYFLQFGNFVNNFIIALNLSYEKILGVGIGIQGLVTRDGSKVIFGNILNSNGISCEDFARNIQFPCILFHDSEAAANAELWDTKDIINAFYISLNRNIGGSAIINSQIHWGSTYPSGLIEHMTIDLNGVKCYCGKKGCFETCCSAQALLKDLNMSLEQFFDKLHSGNKECAKRWNDYLYYLSVAIDNLQMAINCDIIIGGPVASYMTAKDVTELKELIEKDSSFNDGRLEIRLDSCVSVAKGAALHYIKQFINSIG